LSDDLDPLISVMNLTKSFRVAIRVLMYCIPEIIMNFLKT